MDTWNPRACTCYTAITFTAASTTTQEATKPLGHAMDPPKRRKRMLYQPPVDLIQTDNPDYQNFVRMLLAVFDLIEECIHHCIKKEVTNFRKPLQVGLKLAITLRHLATGDTSLQSLQHHWLVWNASKQIHGHTSHNVAQWPKFMTWEANDNLGGN